MSLVATDIIIPVWNGPVETRQCLAALVEHSPHARLIVLDAGGDPETEQVLHDFAEYLDDRMLLLRPGRLPGLVDTLNRGLALASAPLVVVLRTSSLVTPGWLEPLQAATDSPGAGILVPSIAPTGRATAHESSGCGMPLEVSHGTFAALGITARLYREIGGLDGNLDGGEWCLRDYSRRAWQAGFRTVRVDGPPVRYREEVVYGSPERRERVLTESMNIFHARWGEERVYCLCLMRDAGREAIERAFGAALAGAREGNRFFVLAPFRTHRTIVEAGLHRLHENIAIERLSRWFPARALCSAFSALRKTHPDMQLLTGAEGLCKPDGVTGIPLVKLEHHCTGGEV